jgi:putative hydrolase of the HAD superfamily
LPPITAIFWDVGGVFLSNAWDHYERAEAIEKFGLDGKEFQQRHESVVSDFEGGRLSLGDYLDRTVFYQPRPFTREVFQQFMFSRSQPKQDVLQFARDLAKTGKYLFGTINNESTELNEFRIRTFRLRDIFDVFVSSCYVGLRKPDREIYNLALRLTQRAPAECCFIDDRQQNLEPAQELGMHSILMKDAKHLSDTLSQLGVSLE